ncbi:mucolipin-2-like isoform X2 [Protopterus annectens]|uniref:mucolipin-2-like isoform X2 n=1 Tax=Protopterus annectens TaxID=7888 RepID=UPI001CFBEEC2|nr:mucolipin-2-like isoform X2 [Protopterus annectens]
MEMTVKHSDEKSNVIRTSMGHLEMNEEEQSLRRDLTFFFMNPCDKYRARQQIPWKLGLQVLKIIMVTTQLFLFGLRNQLVVAFKEENTLAFKHLFIKDYTGTDEDDFSRTVYTQQDVFEGILFVIDRYHHLRNVSVGTLRYETNDDNITAMNICKHHYRKSKMSPSNETFSIDPTTETDCLSIPPMDPLKAKEVDWRMRNASFFAFDFYRLVRVEIAFNLQGVDLQTIHASELPDCYEFDIIITFDNQAHSGVVKIYFDSDTFIQDCDDWHVSGTVQKNTHCLLIFDAVVILICLTSLILCTRSIILAVKLQERFVKFFTKKYSQQVDRSDRLEFVNGWYILIIISDLMTISGSVMKMEISSKSLTSYDACSICLGSSTLLVWVGVIRYLGYFQKYNVLILTMQASFPKVLRFCCCAGMIYLGYTFCGWIVLGPYHEKFEDLTTAAECLFSLLNGDDMFGTFAEIQKKSNLVWLFSRLYLYSFISLFIYMVLSLFIALITDSYETIKKYQQNGFPVTDLHAFLEECNDLPDSETLGHKQEDSNQNPFICCCKRRGSGTGLLLIT